MDTAATKLLEAATIKTLHAHNFSRSSTQSILVLTDLLARYLELLSETTAKYAQHAGRTGLTAHDALAALDEMGVGVEELGQYCTIEAKEMNRYAQHSARRTEDLNEFKAQLAIGLRQERDDAILLEYQPYESPPMSEYDSEEEAEDVDMEDIPALSETDETEEQEAAMILDSQRVGSPLPLETVRKSSPASIRPSTPPLPLSPISNPSSPSLSPRKRARTSNWKPPSHIPGFLPPFPSMNTDPLPSSIPPSPQTLTDTQSTELMPPPPPPTSVPDSDTAKSAAVDKQHPPIALPLTQAMTASATSDYFVQVPYHQSSLSSVPEWHLPTLPPASSSSSRRKTSTPALPTLQTEPALFKAYHHILTHRPPASPPPSTISRHKVAMAFLSQTQNTPRWDSPDTLFSTVAPCPPRLAVIGPSFPVAISDPAINGKVDSSTKDKEFRFPPTIPRPVAGMERLTPLLGHQTNRIQDLASHVLPPVVMNRITRLAHPPVLNRGTKPLLYGRGIPAPWNSHALPSSDGGGIPPTPISASGKDKNKNKDKDRDAESGDNGNGEKPSKPLLPDAQLFATWDFETKDYKAPLPTSHHSHAGTVTLGPAGRQHRGRVGSSASVSGHGGASGVSGSGSPVISFSMSAAGVTGRSKSGSKRG
ncbi:hypothetical protein D9756_008101 [Leucocoprinus leucothites]|uniref:Bromodomain associated domain-containing protein n=1 Tax=Leucocoprinus leucothites TaxID=201217 RepID=A0A8H5FY80_9AGAR|nr:hypothetical protein D9756_008101 [Leucoagaricus leucothites]